eukprot:Gregarina_sp_Poly_1__3166@NODE_189_length_11663_cov_119_423594_g168_i0_p7_GENE_NODE_189_length_11663_cov_119_423594_g168_i0NODE_189_length_11663_cov_119_423594_g168_i0_p7_ORF_typecomplete_len150_score16_53Acetyltransf_10/PF13673_7/8_8e19Acetyltransf_1/PF00583_25/4_1e14Acetyltransf_7/PF13508_7/1_1e12Acetyltransf_9/PF13527_7/1_3e09GNAT_acetyltran/PF12746_7/2_3e08Acetyltransf_4/PF13420_7/9_1e08FR47/PF08445_10/4e06GNAT_acetyltr_2/PF13718_6/0_00017NodA/PF02474_15/0_00031MOZ_SAS/PF01853_18/0_013Gly_ac
MTVQQHFLKMIAAEDVYPIRHKVLWPDKPISFVKLTTDAQSLHYGVTDSSSNLIAVASAQACSDSSVRVRKIAVLPEHQKQGIGKLLLTHIVEESGKQGFSRCFLYARPSAEGFYAKCGFQPEEGAFEDPETNQERMLYVCIPPIRARN